MATQTKSSESKHENTFVPAIDDIVEQVGSLSEKLVESGKAVGGAWLDDYEKVVQKVLDLEIQIADGTELDWVSAAVKAQAGFVADFTGVYTKAARELLK